MEIDFNKIKKDIKPFYQSKSRCFHNWKHIKAGFVKWDRFTNEQKMAWIFHDIIYIPGFVKNEESSAEFLEFYCLQNKIEIDIKKAKTIIIDTKMHVATIKESKLCLDVDMLSLGLPYPDFLKQRKLAFNEYELIFGKEKTGKGTIEFCRDLLNKDKVFLSEEYFYFNEIAKRNIQSYLIYLETRY